jgi:hypothetical protein
MESFKEKMCCVALSILLSSTAFAGNTFKLGEKRANYKLYEKRPLKALVLEEMDSFFDPNFDYAKYSGRVTDRDETSSIIKIHAENQNIKFFKAGDVVEFSVYKNEDDKCKGFVRNVEKGYLVLYIKDISECWTEDKFFRRGTRLIFNAKILNKRVRDASFYRVLLIKRRRDFLKQLNEINHFVWSFDQQKVQVASKFDKQIIEIQKKKQKELDILRIKKKDQINIQRELIFRLSSVDSDLTFYKVEKTELFDDRWDRDHDLGLPVGRRPQNPKLD